MSAGLAAGGTTTAVVGHVNLAAPEPHCGASSCATPGRFLTIRLRSAGGAVHVVHTDKNGVFKLALAPGTYAVSAGEASVRPSHAVVRQSASQSLTFLYRPSP